MNSVAQFRAYVNKNAYEVNHQLVINWNGKILPVSAIWHLIENGLFK